MKLLKSCIIFVMLTITSSCGQAQNNPSEKQAKETLLEFYSKHFYIWENTPISNAMPANVLRQKLDSLMQKYCTSKVRHEVVKAFDDVGADLLTNDRIGDLNENLRVEKDSTKENWYLVFFTATNPDAKGNSVKQDVILHLAVIKEGESYKIDSIE